MQARRQLWFSETAVILERATANVCNEKGVNAPEVDHGMGAYSVKLAIWKI